MRSRHISLHPFLPGGLGDLSNSCHADRVCVAGTTQPRSRSFSGYEASYEGHTWRWEGVQWPPFLLSHCPRGPTSMSLRIVSDVYFSRVEIMIFITAGARLVDLEYFLGSMKARKDPWFFRLLYPDLCFPIWQPLVTGGYLSFNPNSLKLNTNLNPVPHSH